MSNKNKANQKEELTPKIPIFLSILILLLLLCFLCNAYFDYKYRVINNDRNLAQSNRILKVTISMIENQLKTNNQELEIESLKSELKGIKTEIQVLHLELEEISGGKK